MLKYALKHTIAGARHAPMGRRRASGACCMFEQVAYTQGSGMPCVEAAGKAKTHVNDQQKHIMPFIFTVQGPTRTKIRKWVV